VVTERQLVCETEDYFEEMKYQTTREVPLFENRIDLVVHNRDISRIIAVEVKVDKWFRALQQAVLYRICADKVYVALSEKCVQRVDLPLLMRYGVGLLSVNGNTDEILPPDPTKYITHSTARFAVRISILATGGRRHAERS
jgi:hypothetical protein